MSEEEVHEGLEGIVAAQTRLSHIDGQAGELTIGGFALSELATNATFEETLFLMREDRLPNSKELASFSEELADERELPGATYALLRANADAEPMDALRMGVASLDSRGSSAVNANELVATVPTIVAAHWRLRAGKEPVSPRSDLGHAANYRYMLTDEVPTEAETRALSTYLNSVIDHGLNASTFSARAIVSTETDLVSAVTGAVGALKGPLHGGAPGPVLEMLREIEASGDAEAAIHERLDAGERLMGFGHRVYRTRDPRAAVLSTAVESLSEQENETELVDLAAEVEAIGVEALAEAHPNRELKTNVEFYTAVLLDAVGINPELFTSTFAVSRVGGWTAHCLEQLENNRIVRPRSAYIGEAGRRWTPLDER